MKDKKVKDHYNRKHTRKCVICNQPFNRTEAVCWRCGSCQNCKQLVNDKFGSYCMHCHNFKEQARYDKHAISIGWKAHRKSFSQH